MSEISYRKATIDDVEHLVRLREQQLQEEGAVPKDDISENLTEYFTENIANGSFVSWLAVCNGEIIATSGIAFYRLPPHYGNVTGLIGHVVNMHTLKNHRKKGIAKYLLGKVIEEARMRGYRMIRVNSSSMGRFLYKSFGFYEKNNLLEYRIAE